MAGSSYQLRRPAGLVHIRQMQTFRDINNWAHMNTVGESGTAILMGKPVGRHKIQVWPHASEQLMAR